MRIACDVDDVLGGFYPTMCREFGRPELRVNIWDGKGACAWIAQKFPKLYNDENFWRNISKLSSPESVIFEVDHYITSIPAKLHDIREEWLHNNGYQKKPLICTVGSKVDTMQALGINVLVDDKPQTIKDVRKAGLIGIQFVPPYMSDFDPTDPFTVTHLSQVPDRLAMAQRLLLNKQSIT